MCKPFGCKAGLRVVNNCLGPLSIPLTAPSCFPSCLLQDTTGLQSVADSKSPGRSMNACRFLERPSISSDAQD